MAAKRRRPTWTAWPPAVSISGSSSPQPPTCVASRCNLFTGRYGHSHHIRQNNALLAKHEVHLFKALKQAGYYLGYIEKNDLVNKEEFVNFDFHDLVKDRNHGGKRADYMRFFNQRVDRLGQWGRGPRPCSTTTIRSSPTPTSPAKRGAVPPGGPRREPALLSLRVV